LAINGKRKDHHFSRHFINLSIRSSLALRLQGQSWRCWHNNAVDKVATENAHEQWTSTLRRLEGLPQTLALP
jgi:hypothetical protein